MMIRLGMFIVFKNKETFFLFFFYFKILIFFFFDFFGVKKWFVPSYNDEDDEQAEPWRWWLKNKGKTKKINSIIGLQTVLHLNLQPVKFGTRGCQLNSYIVPKVCKKLRCTNKTKKSIKNQPYSAWAFNGVKTTPRELISFVEVPTTMFFPKICRYCALSATFLMILAL